MSRPTVGIIYYGAGNIYSVRRGLNHIDFDTTVLDGPEEVKTFDRIVLPGVGAFGEGMRKLNSAGFSEAIADYVETGKPLLGICLGAQLIMESSDEFGEHRGLGLIPGRVNAIPSANGMRIPHVGWAPLKITEPGQNSILTGVDNDDQFYFVHSYSCNPSRGEHVYARFDYGPHSLVATVGRENVIGTQFHVELSSHAGLSVLKRFRDW